ncbi:U3 small nucleolar RNA-associated protein 15 homolog [Elysia marginata]|uniref:U3 small nucleolar RNA-associated protein 15 homolog n=1 Tax=Elysia marginata TaxID=1093978 RepID=A0AAV4G0K7_9GAST|nr:U3 small nucleolar RNA-associated protein 15 homolog [Elysia marginata]
MATSFKKTLITAPKIIKDKTTPDGLYWKNLENPITVKEYGAITDIDFCQVKPHNFAVTNSMRVQIYGGQSSQVIGTVSRFKDVAYSGSYRRDGKLLVAGTEDKFIKLFNPDTRSLLRTFKGHEGPVHVTKFLEDQFRIISGSNDKTVRVWDIPTEKEIHVYNEHKDYIRDGVSSRSSQDIFLTGGYDHCVKLWDARTEESVLTVNHGCPVESVLMFPNGGIFLSAGGNAVKVWDALAGGKLLATLTNHHKTVTSLCFCSNFQRFMSASLDKHVKVHDVASYQVVHTLSYPGPILSHGVSPDDELLVVGMADKMLSIQRRKKSTSDKPEQAQHTRSSRLRGHGNMARSFVPGKSDAVFELKRREILAPYDKHLKSFSHSKALDAALQRRYRIGAPEVTVSIMQELIRRGHIRAALSGRDDQSLQGILVFIHKNLSNPSFMGTLIDVFNLILDIYGMPALINSGPLETQLVKLKELISTEVRLMTGVQQIMGSLDLLFTAADNQTPPALPTGDGTLERKKQDSSSSHMEVDSPSKGQEQLADTNETVPLLHSIGSLAEPQPQVRSPTSRPTPLIRLNDVSK